MFSSNTFWVCGSGMPAGETAGHAIAAHMDIDKVAFTGSTEVRRRRTGIHVEVPHLACTFSDVQMRV